MSRLNYIYNIISPTLLDNVTEMNGRVSMKYTKNLVQIMLYSREKRFTGIGTINYAVKRIKNCH